MWIKNVTLTEIKAQIALKWQVRITINPTDVYIRCKNTKNAKHDRSIGWKRIKIHYVWGVFVKLSNEKLVETDMLQVILTQTIREIGFPSSYLRFRNI